MPKVLYLFNSASNPLYLKNVLNTLYLPQGMTNIYRYVERNVAPELYAHPESVRRSADCLVIFVDRHHEGCYQFLPLRRGSVLNFFTEPSLRELRCEVVLGDFVFPEDVEHFNTKLLAGLSHHGLPQLTNGDSGNPADGFYAVAADPYQADRDSGLVIGDRAWPNAVDWLFGIQQFSSVESPPSVFVRCDMIQSDKRVIPSRSNHKYTLRPGRHYSLRFMYKCDAKSCGPDKKVAVEVSDALHVTEPHPAFTVDATHESRVVPALAKRFPDEAEGHVHLDGGDVVTIADANIPFVLRDGPWFWLTAALLLILYAGSVGLTTLLGDRSVSETFWHLIAREWYVLVFVAAQAFALFLLVRQFGKRPV
jgi:hypothetical protein